MDILVLIALHVCTDNIPPDTMYNIFVVLSSNLALIIYLEDPVVKQAHEQSECMPKLLWLAKD